MSFLSIVFYILAFYISMTLALLTAARLTAPSNATSSSPPKTAVSKPHQLLSFVARCSAYVGVLLFCAIYGALAALVLRIFGLGGLSQWATARAFKYTMWFTTGVWFDIVNEGKGWWFGGSGEGGKQGKEGGEWLKRRPVVFVGNHQTELDVLMLGTLFPYYTSVTAKKSLMWVPFLGQFMALSKTVFINRGSHKDALAAFQSAAETIKNEKQNVYIFPEGTRSYASEPMLLPFKKGAFHLAIQAQVPIVPAVAANYSNILSFKKKIFWSGRIPMKVLEPFETKGLTSKDVDDLSRRVRDAMLAEIIKLSAEQGTAKTENGGAVASGVDTGKKVVDEDKL